MESKEDEFTITSTYLKCANCECNISSLDHILDEDGDFGPWNCDECGKYSKFSINNGKVVSCSIYAHNDRVRSISILKLKTMQNRHIYLLVNSSTYTCTVEEKKALLKLEGTLMFGADIQYKYEQNQCLTNWMGGDVIKIASVAGDSVDWDEHGIVDYVGTVILPEDLRYLPEYKPSKKIEEYMEKFILEAKNCGSASKK